MAASLRAFADIATKKIHVMEGARPNGISGPLVFERCTRSYSRRLMARNLWAIGDLNGRLVEEFVKEIPVTRKSFDRALHYLTQAGVSLADPR